MNRITILLTLYLGIWAFAARADYRDFTDASGREINAKLIRYDPIKKKVTIQRKGKGSTTVSISLFSEDDQKYIISWNKNKDFLSPQLLKVEFTRNQSKNADTSRNDSWGEDKCYDCTFSIELENRSSVDFKQVKLEYVIFYTQDHYRNNDNDKKEEKSGRLHAQKTINILKKSTTNIETQKLHLTRRKVYRQTNLGFKMDGIIVKLRLKTDTGEAIYREIKFPDNLDHFWKASTTDAQRSPHGYYLSN